MLNELDILDEKGNTIIVGWDEESEGGKAHGHIVGAGKLPKRDFFGLNKKSVDQVKAEFSSEIKTIVDAKGEKDKEAFSSAVLGLINKVSKDGS